MDQTHGKRMERVQETEEANNGLTEMEKDKKETQVLEPQ